MATPASTPLSIEPAADRAAGRPPGAARILLLSLWCGLVAGLLEVAAIVLRKQTIDPDRLYRMSRHFVWLIPLTDILLLLSVGALVSLLLRPWRRGWWFGARLLATMTLLPALLALSPQIHGVAWLVLAAGLAMRLVPMLERHAAGFGRLVGRSLPLLIAGVAVLAAANPIRDAIAGWRLGGRPLPPPGSPNVVLVVLDTVAAGHLSLHGYERPTSRTLEELAERAIRFTAVRSTSSWTLPSHASLFTGRWPHELSTGWLTPLDATHPTLAESLLARGYDTAGFVGNTMFCAWDSGLGRGFGVFRDYTFPRLTAFKPAALVDRAVALLPGLAGLLADRLGWEGAASAVQELWLAFAGNRKDAAAVHREFLDWLDDRPKDRPFFAFLNDFDAHVPYELPPGHPHRFGSRPETERQRQVVRDWWPLDKGTVSPQERRLIADLYDDCLADLDEQLGRLYDALGRRGVLDSTWLIITSDHGESFGEHEGVYCHGTSLYQTELHVPLLIVPPGGTPPRVIEEAASLRDLAATVAELTTGGAEAPFPGRSLSRFWMTAPRAGDPAAEPPLSEVVPIDPAHLDPSSMLRPRWPLAALAEDGWTYLRREGDVREELFRVAEDRLETRNRAAEPADQDRLARLRATMGRMTGGPLTPGRFRP